MQAEGSESTEDMETAVMKERLNFHFMNPFQKWKNSKKRRFPWKLLVQLISIILVTTQVGVLCNDFRSGKPRSTNQDVNNGVNKGCKQWLHSTWLAYTA